MDLKNENEKKVLFEKSKNILKNIINEFKNSRNLLNEITKTSKYEISFIHYDKNYYVKKKVSNSNIKSNENDLKKEIVILKQFKNLNDIYIIDHFPKINLKLSTDSQIITKFDGIDLFTLTSDFNFFVIKKIIEFKYIFKQVITALDFLHSLHLTHGDVKPENILINDNLKITLIDYDLSFYGELAKISKSFGSVEYLSPEIYNCKKITYKTDIWSLGATMYCCYTSKCLYQNKEQKHYIDVMTCVNYLENYIKHLKIEKEFEELLLNFMKYEPNDRIGLKKSIKYSFFNSLKYKYFVD